MYLVVSQLGYNNHHHLLSTTFEFYLVPVSEIGRYVQWSFLGTELIQTSVESTKTKVTE